MISFRDWCCKLNKMVAKVCMMYNTEISPLAGVAVAVDWPPTTFFHLLVNYSERHRGTKMQNTAGVVSRTKLALFDSPPFIACRRHLTP